MPVFHHNVEIYIVTLAGRFLGVICEKLYAAFRPHPHETGAENILTEYKVLEEGEGMSLVEVTLHTGKTHQIRAHLAHIGCPLVGDMKYGDTQKNKERNLSRQCLVSKHLRIFLEGEFSYLSDHIWTSQFEAKL